VSKDETKSSEVVGCGAAALHLACTLPIRAALTFWLLQATAAPTWCWVAFWVYVPVSVAAGCTEHMAKLLSRRGE
jgi:hypothetical protein